MPIVWKETPGSRLAISLHYKARDYFPPYEAWLRWGHRKARTAYRERLSTGGKLVANGDLITTLRTNAQFSNFVKALDATNLSALLKSS